MKAMKQPTAHQRLVLDIINGVGDRDIQEELRIINNQYRKATNGLRLAYACLQQIDETCGTEHNEIISEVKSAIEQVKDSEIALLEMSAHYSNDCFIGEYPEEGTK
jgi:hypothetical protein